MNSLKITYCIVCKAEIKYKTRKPKKCKECVNSKSRWKKEYLMFKLLEKVFPNEYYIRNGFYSFLISPKGEPMQLDIYFPNLMLAFEFQGRQHYQFNKFFHKTLSQFEYLKECDLLKIKLCKGLGIKLIQIPYNKELTVELIERKLK